MTNLQKIYPPKSIFNSMRKKFNMIPLFAKIKGDINVISIYNKLRGNYSFILNSSMIDKNLGRYSFIGFEPFLVISSKGNNISINGKRFVGNPIDLLKKKLNLFKSIRYNELPLFFGGVVGYFAYDIVHFFERLPKTTKQDVNSPDMYFLFIDKSVIYDHIKNELIIVVLGNNYDECMNEVMRISRRIFGKDKPLNRKILCRGLSSNFTKDEYIKAILKVKEYISAGDTFQVNLSQRLEGIIEGDCLAIYERLAKINPAPFSALLEFPEIKIVCSSPERLVRLENNIVSTRPIAGTRARGKTSEDDMVLENELKSNEKEMAEHTMLVDLERNDLGKVCDYGSVKVTEIMSVEKYSHVMHLVSNITGKLHKTKDCFELIKAVFPGGTITGCPKIRTMEIIDELEPTSRGVYTGSLGYFNFCGEMELNIIIRTLVVKKNKVYLQVGGGIVADSVPMQEYRETLDKAQAMIDALAYL